jgi:hypothetical protein
MLTCQTRCVAYRLAAILTVTAFCCGCSRAPDPNRFIPASEPARAALEAVLVDWQAGLPRGTIARLPMKVEPIDNQRKASQALAGFEILGEVPQQGVRCFVVRLKFRNSEVEEKVRYVVHGIDPLFVYRQEDFELLNHWDHMMPSQPGEKVPHSDAESLEPTPDQPPQPESSSA